MDSVGRPIEYTKEIGDEICSLLADGRSLRSICESVEMPARQTVIRWVVSSDKNDDLKGFRNQYTQAREVQYESMFDECLDIADDGTNDWATREAKDGSEYEVVNREVLQRSKLRIDTRLTIIERMKPKKYGKINQTDHTSTDGSMSPAKTEDDLAQRLKDLGVEC